eukprot:2778677-Amphidinium_carterae.1
MQPTHLKEWPMKTSINASGSPRWANLIESNGVSLDGALNAHCTCTVSPENKATALLRTHRQRSDTCKKPGTAFTMEYQIPGREIRTLVAQA